MLSKIAFLNLLAIVAAHGTVSGIVADGILYVPPLECLDSSLCDKAIKATIPHFNI